MRVSIIGAGRLGTSLGRALAAHGFSPRAVCDLNAAKAAEGRRAVGAGLATTDAVLAAGLSDVLFLCLPDDALAGEARRLAGKDLNWRGKTVFHCSGLLPASVLGPLRRRGASVASFHPVRSFPEKGAPPSAFRGIAVGLEGHGPARLLGRRIALKLGARPLSVRVRDKAMYHAACSLASNCVLVLFHLAARLLADTGMSSRRAESILLPLAQGSLQNVNKIGSRAALTGPVVRGDSATVEKHLRALERRPALLRAYKILAAESLRLARRGSLSPASLRTLNRLLRDK